MGGKSKNKTKTNNSIDPWSRAQYTAGRSAVNTTLNSNPFTTYDGQMVAGLSDAERTGMDNYGATLGQANGILGDAITAANGVQGYVPGTVTAGTFRDFDPSAYMNPYEDEVVGRAMSDMDRARQMAISDQEGSIHRSSFGGSRHGVADAITNERFIDQAGNVAAGLRSAGYDRATGLYGADMDREMNAGMFNEQMGLNSNSQQMQLAGLLSGLSSQYGDNAAREAQIMTMLGTNERAVDQAGLDAQYREFLRGEEDPYRRAQMQLGLLGTTPIIQDSNSTSTQSQTPGIAGILGTAAQVGSLFMSDVRAKTDIVPLGERDGQNWYQFRYKDDPEGILHEGVMAQEVMQTRPDAVEMGDDGVYRVDYGALQ